MRRAIRTAAMDMRWAYVTTSGREVVSDFSDQYQHFGTFFYELFDAARRLSAYNPPATVATRIHHMLRLARAIADYSPSSALIADWEQALIKHLSALKVAGSTKNSSFNGGVRLLREIARHRGHSHTTSRNPFPKTRQRETPYLESTNLQDLLNAAKNDALAYYNDFRTPPTALLLFLEPLRKIAKAAGGVLPLTGVWAKKVGRRGWSEVDSLFQKASLQGITPSQLRRLVAPQPIDLVPFIILITYGLLGNVESIVKIERARIMEYTNPLTGKRLAIHLNKPRAGGDLEPYQVADRGTLSVAWCLRAVADLTSQLVSPAPARLKPLLFLASNHGRVLSLTGSNRHRVFIKWLALHGLPHTTLSALRPTNIINDYAKHHDLRRSQTRARHGSARTSLLYLDHALAKETDEAIIARAQRRVFGMTIPSVDLGLPTVDGPSRGIVLPTHRCIDPTSPNVPHDENGICVNVLWPLNDRHFVMPRTPRNVAFLLRDYFALKEAQLKMPAAQFAKYAPKLRYIERFYLPDISDELFSKAVKLIETLPKGPVLE